MVFNTKPGLTGPVLCLQIKADPSASGTGSALASGKFDAEHAGLTHFKTAALIKAMRFHTGRAGS